MRKLFLLAGLIMTSYLLHAQKNLTGIIKDVKTNQPIPGVSVRVKSNSTGTTTNSNGQFSINATPGDVLEFTMIGFKTQSITVSDQTQLNINLESSSTELTEIVFVGNRGGGRAKIETPVPVDVIRINQVGLPTAKMDLTSVLNYAAPSYNYNKQSGADGADHIDVGTLENLVPIIHWF